MKSNNQIQLCVDKSKFSEETEEYLKTLEQYEETDIPAVINKMKNGGIGIAMPSGEVEAKFSKISTQQLLKDLSAYRLVELKNNSDHHQVSLKSSSEWFNPFEPIENDTSLSWKVSRFSYLHFENNQWVLRNPKAKCYLILHDEKIIQLFQKLQEAHSKKSIEKHFPDIQTSVFDLFIRAKIIVSCDDENTSVEEKDATLRQWDFHDLIFHSLSRTGRTEKNIGGSFRFKDILPPQPPVKENPWKANAIPLPKPNMQWLFYYDKPFTNVLETRKSTRQYSPVPLTFQQLGEFLYRSLRTRYEYSVEGYGDFVSKPYPGGGANYETEFYITIHACSGIPRGMYYYDAKEHTLCLVSTPNQEMENLLWDAHLATAQQGFPQILITLANRFNRFNWKYSSMSYAAQLKNIGVIYQTMYLVATSMGIGACGLGVGNTERFAQLTGLSYFEEGSLGEFMLGNPTG